MDFQEFSSKTKKAHVSRKVTVRNSWGVYDAYKALRKQGWLDIGRPLKEKEFYSIIRGVNNLAAEKLGNGETLVLPCKMGKLELRKTECGAIFVHGRLKVTYPIDWSETLHLWYEDEEARRNKLLKRSESKYIFRVKYNKYSANYENKCFYLFCLNRKIKKTLKNNIQQGKIDTLW